jgi:hypothetical protein
MSNNIRRTPIPLLARTGLIGLVGPFLRPVNGVMRVASRCWQTLSEPSEAGESVPTEAVLWR